MENEKEVNDLTAYSKPELAPGSYTIVIFIDTETADELPEMEEPYNCASGFFISADNEEVTQDFDIVKTLAEFLGF